MEVLEPIGDEANDLASDVDSIAQSGEDGQIRIRGSGRYGSNQKDRLLTIVRSTLESGYWDSLLPKYEKSVLQAATASETAWRHFLDVSSTPSLGQAISSGAISASSSNSTGSGRKASSSASAAKVQKSSSRPKRASTPRRRGADTDISESQITETLQSVPITNRDLLETLHTRLRTFIFDTIVDEVLHPNEKHLERFPASKSIKSSIGIPNDPLELEPFFTLEDVKEAKESTVEELESQTIPEYHIPASANDATGGSSGLIIPSRSESPFPGEQSGTNEKSTSTTKSSATGTKRRTGSKREVRNLMTDSKTSRKWERLELIGASPEYRAFVGEMEKILQALKDQKTHSMPFLKPIKESDFPDYKTIIPQPMDLNTVSKNIDNMIYWTKSSFQRDIVLIFSNCKAYFTEPDDLILVQHCNSLEAIALPLLNQLDDDIDFTAERDSLKEILAQVIPEAYPSIDSVPSSAHTSVNASSSCEQYFSSNTIQHPLEHASATTKRTLFFREDPSITKLRQQVQQLAEKSSDGGDMDVDSVNDQQDEPQAASPRNLPFQWHTSIPEIYPSLVPGWPTISQTRLKTISNPCNILPVCSADRLVEALNQRNQALLSRVTEFTKTNGHAPLDPTFERPLADPPSTTGTDVKMEETKVLLIEPKPEPIKVPSLLQSSSLVPPATLSASNIVPKDPIIKEEPSQMAVDPKMEDLVVTDPSLGENRLSQETPMPLFSAGNMIQEDPLASLDAHTLVPPHGDGMATVLDKHAVHDLMKQICSIHLTMRGFTDANEAALNLLAEIMGSFITRIGFLSNNYTSAPGTRLDLTDIMSRVMSDIFPRGIQTVKLGAISDAIRSDNCLKLNSPATVQGWIDSSPSLIASHTQAQQYYSQPNTMPAPSDTDSRPDSSALEIKFPAPRPIDTLVNQIRQEERQHEASMSNFDTKEHFLQHSPFVKKTQILQNARQPTYFGSTSSQPIGLPTGLHLVVPAASTHVQAAPASVPATHPAPIAISNAPAQPGPGQLPMQHAVMAPPGNQPAGAGHPNPAPNRGYPPMNAPNLPQNAPIGRAITANVPQQPPMPAAAAAKKMMNVPAAAPNMNYSHMNPPSLPGHPPAQGHVQHLPQGYLPTGSPRGPYTNPVPSSHLPPVPHQGPTTPIAPKKGVGAKNVKPRAGVSASPTAAASLVTAVTPPSLDDANRGSSAKRKRPATFQNAAAVDEDDTADGERRGTRARRGAAQNLSEEYAYDDEGDDDPDEPKRKRRKTPAKPAKR